ncbi:MAG: hypothetical protein K6T86_00260 [Pirellulales bacterium]|nr:hypothetical protein [Pirellulales bacterium]
MSAATGQKQSMVPPAAAAPGPGAAWAARFTPLHLAYALVLGGLFLYFNYLPLFHTDLWGHVAFGEWILEHQALPTEDPWQPLAEGMPLVDSAWLGQVVLAITHKLAGAAGLTVLFAMLMAAAYGLLARAFVLRSGYTWLGLLGVGLVVIIGWSRLMTLRPEVLGSICFAAVLWLAVVIDRSLQRGEEAAAAGERPAAWLGGDLGPRQSTAPGGIPLWTWVLLPLVMMLWANLHGSFVCGLAMLVCLAGGQIVESAWQRRSLWGVLADSRVRQTILLAELSAAATLVNPYGMDLWIEVLRFSANENLRDITEWYPLVLASPTGAQFALAWLAAVILARLSPLRIQVWEVLAWLLFSFLVATSLRMVGWFSMAASLVLIRHLGGTIRGLAGRHPLKKDATAAGTPLAAPARGSAGAQDASAGASPGEPAQLAALAGRLAAYRSEGDSAAGGTAIAAARGPAPAQNSSDSPSSGARPSAQDTASANVSESGSTLPVLAARGHWYWCAATLFVLWVVFALSDLSRPILGGTPRSEQRLYSRQTPLELTRWLHANPPQGQVFNPQWWGDWLAYRGPAGMKLFATTHVHLIPPRVYRDYTRIASVREGWEEALARYRVTTVIVDKELMQSLLAAMRQRSGWGLRYEDGQAAVFIRQGPGTSVPANAAASNRPEQRGAAEPGRGTAAESHVSAADQSGGAAGR